MTLIRASRFSVIVLVSRHRTRHPIALRAGGGNGGGSAGGPGAIEISAPRRGGKRKLVKHFRLGSSLLAATLIAAAPASVMVG